MSPPSPIEWPARFAPEHSPIHVSNSIETGAAIESVWSCLVDAARWPHYYEHASEIRLENGARRLEANTRFSWKTSHIRLRTIVTEYEPFERLAWQAEAPGVQAYHAWLLTPTADGGCRILTEETQRGWFARLGALFTPGRMHRVHQLWLEGLAAEAGKGSVPDSDRV